MNILFTFLIITLIFILSFIIIRHYKKKHLLENIRVAQMLGRAASLRDRETGIHNVRVAYMSSILGEALGLGKKSLQALMKGAFLHDIGKIGVSDNILLKEDILDDAERETMKGHPHFGLHLIKDIPWFHDAHDVIFHHHEKFDGTGYPYKLKADAIPLNARIFSIIDVFDALLATRPYKKPFSTQKAIEIIKEESGSHFDPKIVEKFLIFAPDFAQIITNGTLEELQKKLEQRRKQIFGI